MSRRSVELLLCMLVFCAANLTAAERIALVIGNGDYKHITALSNPPKDVRLISDALDKVGFDVTTLIDAGEDEMLDAIFNFSKRIDASGRETVGLFYFAGHGINYDGNNWLIPVDAKVNAGPDVERQAVSARYVLKMMEEQKNATNIMILDACRDNPFKGIAFASTRSLTRGMARMEAPEGSFIAFSTAEGDVAYDGKGDYSPFADAFAAEIGTPDISINDMMVRVNARVRKTTVALGPTPQIPWVRHSLSDLFWFNPGAAGDKRSGGSDERMPGTQPVARPRKKSRAELEDKLWADIKNSNDAAEFAVFLKQYPDGEHAELAKIRQSKFSKKPDRQAVAKLSTTQPSAVPPSAILPSGAQPQGDQNLVALCRQFAAGDSDAFADCMEEMAEADEGDWYGPDGYPPNMPSQQMSTQAMWYDDQSTQWQVTLMGDNFTASAMVPGSGRLQLKGQSQGYALSYGIFNSNGQQIGTGQGTILDANHIGVTNYWSNGNLMGSTKFHVNHAPQ